MTKMDSSYRCVQLYKKSSYSADNVRQPHPNIWICLIEIRSGKTVVRRESKHQSFGLAKERAVQACHDLEVDFCEIKDYAHSYGEGKKIYIRHPLLGAAKTFVETERYWQRIGDSNE